MIDDSIAAPGLAHRAMAPELDLLADLTGGTTAMRRAGQRWLPREANESWTAWRARLGRSVLFNGLSRTVQALAGRPFSRPVALADADDELMRLAADIDGEGTGIGGFAGMLLRALLTDGMVHVLVDRPRRGGPPYFVIVRAAQLIGARRDESGLTDIRISERLARPTGRFGEESLDAVRRAEAAQLQNEALALALSLERERLAAQAGLVAAEAGGASWLQRNWRPITMLSFLGLVVADAFGLLAFRLADQAWLLLQIGLGGYVVGRSVEKISPQISAIAGPAGTAASERPRPKPNGTPRAKSTGRAGHAKSG